MAIFYEFNRATFMSAQYQLDDLLYLMSRLRDPNGGCPWDQAQTFNSIVPYTIEEVYEVADAIEQTDFAHVKEELGDLLFQVVFYAQMGKEQDLFEFGDIIHTLVSKLIRRHPHVFPDGTLSSRNDYHQALSEGQVKGRWEAIKQQERDSKEPSKVKASLLADIPRALPAIQRAEKLQKRASSVGFDWPEASQVLDKIEEEIAELREAMQAGNPTNIEDELGDVMFAMVNLARHVKVKPEMAIRSTNIKFERRFNYVEQTLLEQGSSLQQADLDTMEALWVAAKQFEK